MSESEPRIRPLRLADADPVTTATLDGVQAKLGTLPNLFTTLAQSPTALNAYLQLSSTLGNGRLTAKQRESIALAVGESNACQYCLSAHTVLGRGAGLSEQDVAQARQGRASNPKDAAIAGFARLITEQRGVLADADLDALREAGVDDGLVLEVIANVAMHVLTNYVNHVAGTEVDFPPVALQAA